MLPRLQCLVLALVTALLIIMGSVGIFAAEASSFRILVQEAQSYDRLTPIDAYDISPEAPDSMVIPGSPY